MNKSKKQDLKKEDLPSFEDYRDLPHIPVSIGVKGSMGNTGEWRTFRPVINLSACNKCGFCYIYCPEGTIKFDKETGPMVDYIYCKGCGVCARECPKDAITMRRETEQVCENDEDD
ncbi:4Fe-4S dicluster domain-containing protein [Candidatus Bathyarchaeota archaeon]|nr:4Fe-4S dicluster domain-containing protein [Candidatus Bathyarchaeota archaeon]